MNNSSTYLLNDYDIHFKMPLIDNDMYCIRSTFGLNKKNY